MSTTGKHYVVAILIAIASAKTGMAQTRIYRSPRDMRRYRQYDEENAGGFPKRIFHYRTTRASKVIKNKLPKEVLPKEHYYYGGLLLGIGISPYTVNGNPQVQFDYSYNNSTSSTYTGSIQGNQFGNYFTEFSGGVEFGKVNGLFFSMNAAGSAHSNLDVFRMDLTIGKNFLLHNNRWKISPSISIGGTGSNVTMPQTLDNHQDATILGSVFPVQYSTQQGSPLSDEINLRLHQESGILSMQCGVSPRIKQEFPIRITIGYNFSFGNRYTVIIQSPVKKEEFAWNKPGLILTNPGYDPGRLGDYQGVFFRISIFIKTRQFESLHPLR